MVDDGFWIYRFSLRILLLVRIDAHLHLYPAKEVWQLSVGQFITVAGEDEVIFWPSFVSRLDENETRIFVAPSIPLEYLLPLFRNRTLGWNILSLS